MNIPDRFTFDLQMYRAEQDARLHHIPHCPLRADERALVDGEMYTVNWSSREGLSKTMPLDATVINLRTGRSLSYQVIRARRQSRGQVVYRYNLSGEGNWTGRPAASQGLAELAAPHTGALLLWNPMTGAALLPAQIGGAA